MKRFSVIFVVLALCLSLCACSCGDSSDTHADNKVFERVAVYDDCSIYRHKDTNVLYAFYGSGYQGYGGGFTVMFNADGTPMVWSGR